MTKNSKPPKVTQQMIRIGIDKSISQKDSDQYRVNRKAVSKIKFCKG